jgi:hypothetical protein
MSLQRLLPQVSEESRAETAEGRRPSGHLAGHLEVTRTARGAALPYPQWERQPTRACPEEPTGRTYPFKPPSVGWIAGSRSLARRSVRSARSDGLGKAGERPRPGSSEQTSARSQSETWSTPDHHWTLRAARMSDTWACGSIRMDRRSGSRGIEATRDNQFRRSSPDGELYVCDHEPMRGYRMSPRELPRP